MNKKTYLAPVAIMVNLKTVGMNAGSEGTKVMSTTKDASGADQLSRQSSGWDDED